jgi:uroporphyrinogen-III synthase
MFLSTGTQIDKDYVFVRVEDVKRAIGFFDDLAKKLTKLTAEQLLFRMLDVEKESSEIKSAIESLSEYGYVFQVSARR